jgi:hypothetical protein
MVKEIKLRALKTCVTNMELMQCLIKNEPYQTPLLYSHFCHLSNHKSPEVITRVYQLAEALFAPTEIKTERTARGSTQEKSWKPEVC